VDKISYDDKIFQNVLLSVINCKSDRMKVIMILIRIQSSLLLKPSNLQNSKNFQMRQEIGYISSDQFSFLSFKPVFLMAK
jgi:hypothetical protein